MQALVDEILHCIIHKPVAGHPALAGKRRAGNANPKVRAESLRIGTGMAGMRCAFVQDFKMRWRQQRPELLLYFLDTHRQSGVDAG